MDRIETIYQAIDQMFKVHNTSRPEEFGGGLWDFNEEIELWKKQIIGHEVNPLTPLQWTMINLYIKTKSDELNLDSVETRNYDR
jgi:hypothetical protein